ncbi:MAG: YdbL family protein [Candidatus Omnitrophica bacterium]|nr:YdbL family protein [Candidatus Omnitrophota bacterium]
MRKISFIFGLVATVLLTGAVHLSSFAASYDIKEMTPEVKAALDARRGRFDQLASLKAQGAVGENNRGYVEVLKDMGPAQSVVASENQDRKLIYNTIVKQNDLPANSLTTIEKVFAQVQRDKAASGDSVQNESGAWTKK